MNEQEITGTLNNWYWFDLSNNIHGNLVGDVRNRWRDGQFIYTSSLKTDKNIGPKLKEGDIVETQNSRYKLGTPAAF